MSLLQPLGLLGLALLPLIVLLHLLRERSRRARVSSLDLWRWLEKEVRGPRLRRIPLSLILLLHLLAALLLTAAVTQPQLAINVPFGQAARLILVVDTTTSMGAAATGLTLGDGSRLAQAQAHAAALLAGLGATDSAVLITAGPRAQQIEDTALAGTPAQGLASVRGAVAALRAAGAGNDWAGALALAAAATLPGHANRIVILTDGAFAFPAHLEALAVPASVEWRLVGGPLSNQAVVTLAARPSASGAVQVFARLANFSDVTANKTITLLSDSQVRDEFQLLLDASQVTGQAWTMPPGAASVEVRLSGGDALPADDQAALGVAGALPIDVLLVADAPAVVQRALAALPNVRLQTVAPAAYDAFDRHELTVFYQWLPEAWPRGAVLVIEPPSGAALLPVLGRTQVGALLPAGADALLADVDLGPLRFGDALGIDPGDTWTPVLTDVNGLGLIWRGAAAGSRLVAFTFNLEASNLPRRAAFPILIANAVSALLPAQLPPSIGPGEAIALPSADLFPLLTLTRPDGSTQTLGNDRPATLNDTFTPGLYVLRGQSAAGDTWQSGVGVNAGTPEESELRLSAQPAFAAANPGALDPRTTAASVIDLWPWVVLVVVLVLLAEAWVAWR